MSFPKIRIVMVETSHPGNIGAAARAMKNMQLTQLYLVNPQLFPHPDATARATGADDVLEQAVICPSLAEALQGCHHVYGASARSRRHIPWPLVDPRSCATAVAQMPPEQTVAVVFGREHSGLSNEELELCHTLLHIPCNPDYSSLNVAAAIQVVSYELHMARLSGQTLCYDEIDSPPVTAEQLEGLFTHLERVMLSSGFLDPNHPRHLMRRLRRLFLRTRLEQNELNILRGILTSVEKPER